MYRCPNCGDADNIEILISVWATLVQPEYDPEAFETEVEGQDHEWDENSEGSCKSCGHRAAMATFEVDEGEEPDEETLEVENA